jgi:hypothetical protein
MTKYLFFSHNCSPLELMGKHREEYHKKLFLKLSHDKRTIQNHKVLKHSQLSHNYFVKNNILWFYISMNDLIWMQLIDSRYNLSHNMSNFKFRHRNTSMQMLIELSTESNLKNNINIFIILKKSIHFNNIRMI